MTNRHRISTAYLRLILAAEPDLWLPLSKRFDELSSSALEQDYMDGEIADRLFPVLESMGVESIALRFSKQMQLSSHGPVGFAALCAPDLRTALQTISEYSATRSTIVTTSLREDRATIKITNRVQSANPLVRRWLSEISTSVVRSIIETIMAHDIGAQTSIHFDHPKPEYYGLLNKNLGTICRYAEKENVLSIPASWGDVKSPLSDQSSYLDNVAKCRSILLSLSSHENSVSLVRHHLNQFFSKRYAAHTENQYSLSQNIQSEQSKPPTLPEIAQALAVSARTLARRLEARGSSYKSLLRSQRSELAVQWLSTTHLNIADIAYLLAYHETANFTRAFKSWHNCSPQAWRKLSPADRGVIT